jgi:hypothetical protein
VCAAWGVPQGVNELRTPHVLKRNKLSKANKKGIKEKKYQRETKGKKEYN